MVKSDSVPEKGYAEQKIVDAVLKGIGGRPENFYKATVTQVHQDTFRVNIWTATPGGEIGFLRNAQISHSEFYYLPS